MLQGKLQLGSTFQRRDTIDMTESTECGKTPAVAGGEEEVTSMGDILCDIFNSQFCHGNFAPSSPQDLFGILDILESPDQDASKFLSLLEESSAGNNDGTHFPAISPLKLPVLEQEPELDNPEPLINRAIRDNFPSRPDNSPEVNAHSNSLSIDHIALSHAIAHRPDQPKGKRQLTEISDRAIQNNKADNRRLISQKSCEEVMQKSEASFQFRRETITDHARPSDFSESETDTLEKPSIKRFKAFTATSEEGDGAQRMTHIAVERNRRKQMNEHLAVLRSLMPGFYVQRGDQASIIGGVIEFIKELQQLLQSLESKKQRKTYTEVLSPRPSSSPRPSLSPRTLPVSPRTPQPCNPYRSKIQSFIPSTIDQNFETVKELVANSKSAVADVEVKISGSNALLKTLSHKTPGQILKIVKALENLSLEILHLNISTIDDTVLNSFTLKIGIECKLSVEELAQAVQQTFC